MIIQNRRLYIGGIYWEQPGGVMPPSRFFIKKPYFPTEKFLKKPLDIQYLLYYNPYCKEGDEMNIREIVKAIKGDKGCSYSYLAEKTGKKSFNNISEMFRKESINTNSMIMLLDAMDYDIVIQPKEGFEGKVYKLDEVVRKNEK